MSPFLVFSGPAMAPTAFAGFALDCPEINDVEPADRVDLTDGTEAWGTRRGQMLAVSGLVNQSVTYRPPSVSLIERWRDLSMPGQMAVLPGAIGTCHDIAVTKVLLLRRRLAWRSGWLALALVVPPEFPHERHLVVVVRTKAGDLVLDQLARGQAPVWHARNYVEWVAVQSQIPGRWWAVAASASAVA